jgi:hypothetical protein
MGLSVYLSTVAKQSSVNAFQRQRRNFGGGVFYAFVSCESQVGEKTLTYRYFTSSPSSWSPILTATLPPFVIIPHLMLLLLLLLITASAQLPGRSPPLFLALVFFN